MSNPSVQNPAPVKATMRRITPNREAAVAAIKTGVVEAPGGVQVESITGHGPATDLQAELLEQDAPIDVQATPMAPNGVTEQSTAVAVVSQSANAVAVTSRSAAPSEDGFEGEFDSNDIKHPRMNVVQGVGPLSAEWPPGTLLLGDEELLPAPDKKNPANNPVLRFIPIQLTKQFTENISNDDYNNGIRARTVSTISEVEALGGITQWIGDTKPTWQPSARVLMLIQQPENSLHPGFAFELDGKFYAPAIFYAAKTNWKRVAVPIYSAKATSLVEGKVPNRKSLIHKCVWTMQIKQVPAGPKNTMWAPEIRLMAKEVTGPELRDFVAQLKGCTEAIPVE